jgi:hypothetical protein
LAEAAEAIQAAVAAGMSCFLPAERIPTLTKLMMLFLSRQETTQYLLVAGEQAGKRA